jgi:hypothetical protein
MAKREKRLKKQILGLEKQIKKHRQKILEEIGRKDTTQRYWEKEIFSKFSPAIEHRKKILGKSKKKR